MISELTNSKVFGLTLIVVTFLLASTAVILKSRSRKESNVNLVEKEQFNVSSVSGRPKGKWTPVQFTPPLPEEFENFDPKTTAVLPYRPFKHNYFVTMGIRSMDWNSWIELDKDWDKYHNRKLERLAEEKAEILIHTDPSAQEAAEEFLDMLVRYLTNRYPKMFKKTAKGIDNLHTGESFDTVTRPWIESPMHIASKLIQDDLAIMIEGEDGQYYLKSGSILLAGFWRLKDKLNCSLAEIHTSGDVPQFKEKLQSPMERFFLKMQPDKPVVRNNYFLQTDDDIAWSHAIGPEDSEVLGWFTAKEAEDAKKLNFRSERQSLVRLPKTGAIVFTIRTYFLPLPEICHEPYVPGRLLDAVKAWQEDVREYKGLAKYERVLVPFLQKSHEKQIEDGIYDKKEPVSYPF